MKDRHEPMHVFEYGVSRELMVRLGHDTDLVQSIVHLASSRGIKAASFTAIGALKRARIGYYDQGGHQYREIEVNSPSEMISCLGNVSLKEGEFFVHAHVVLGDAKGNVKAGHLFEGIVYAAEVHLCQVEGARLERKYDEVTGLSLWKRE
jgi:predicted DNA-binding protein with PD1-like motif